MELEGRTLISVLTWSLLASGTFAAGIQPCRADKEDLETCLKENLNAFIPLLAKGWTEDLPGLDPLLIPAVESDYMDVRHNTSLDLRLKDVVIVGLSNTRVYLVRGKSLEEGKLELMCKTPAVTATGIYTSKGSVVFLPLYSDGPFNISLGDLTSHLVVHLTSTNNHLQVMYVGLSVMPSLIDVQAGDQLDMDNKLGETLNLYLRENSFELYDLIQPRLVSFFSELIKNLANSMLLQVPESEVFTNLRLKR